MFSHALGREEHCKQISLACVHSDSATLCLHMCAFPVYTAQTLGCSAGNCLIWALVCMHFPGLRRSGSGSWVLHKGTDLVGPVFCAIHRSEQLRRPGAWRAHSPQVGLCIFSPPWSQPLGFLGAQQECHLRCAVCLLWGADVWL